MCALDSTGTAYCWGWNFYGELGAGLDETTLWSSNVPVAVDTTFLPPGVSFTQIAAGGSDTCALDAAGAAYCWGYDEFGELGDNSTVDSDIPVAVDTSGVLAGQTLTQVTVGWQDACAVGAGGAAFCWGDNSYGELGNDITGNIALSPVLTGPQPPAHVTALPGVAAATVSWAAPASLDGGTVEGYTATAEPGGQACNTTGSTGCSITGLTGGTTYSITVVAYTTVGYSGASTPTSVTPLTYATPPDPPTEVSAVPGNAAAVVSWSAPASDGGSPITSYTVTATDTSNPVDGGQTATGPVSPLTVSGLTPGGSYTFTVTAANALGTSAPSASSNAVTIGEPPAITSAATTSIGMRAPLDFTVTTTGLPVAAITETGSLPAGVTFTDNGDGTATLAGTAGVGTAGTYPISITASNGVGNLATQSFTLTVTSAASAPTVSSSPTATETFGVAFTFPVTTTGYPLPKLTKTGALPPGVTFTAGNDGTAAIAGTPAKSAVGTYPLTITVKNSAGSTSQAFTLTITKAPVIRTIPTTTAHVSTALNLDITAVGYTTPAITESGTLPDGLSFTDNGNGTAAITGTPAAGSGGSYSITITAANQLGTAAQTFTLKVDEKPAITSATSTAATMGAAFAFPVTASGYPAAKITEAGILPAGVTFKTATATLAGTPKTSTAGSYRIVLTATNSSGTVTQNFTLTVSAAQAGPRRAY